MKNIIRENSALYHFVQWVFFPLVLIGTPAIIYLLVGNGSSVALTTYIVAVGVGLLFWLMEWLMPFKKHWNHSHGDIANDLTSGIIAYIILPIFLKPLYIALLAGGAVWLSVQWGGAIWPNDWPVIAQLILLLVIGDAGRYWGHRLAHTVPLLWNFHAVHHSTKRLYWWNATRQHPVDKAWFTFTEMLFPVLLGADGIVLSMYFGVTVVCGFSQHCNINLKLGPLYWFFNVVDLHRWHHSKKIGESNNNYGNNLIIFDRLFGTYFHPERQTDPNLHIEEIGLLNPDYPENYLGQLKAPFQKGMDKPQDN
ncbi:MAG: sterol desaturase family protein [Saprospiraceae bacterium]